jgi:calcineurin-like phosphoesterase family protein
VRIFFTSDTHFGHKNIIKYSNRPFNDVKEMDEAIIRNWNATVQPGDTIYHLGDFGLTDTESIIKVLRRLNGNKYLIWGNHDKGIRGEALKHFGWAKDYYELKYEEYRIILCHYAFEVWNKSHHGSFHLHGHSHGSLPTPNHMRRLDVGVDVHGYRPISLEEVVAHMSKKEWKPIDHHGENQYNGE